MGPTYNCPDCDEKHFCSVCGAKTLAYYRAKFKTGGSVPPTTKAPKTKAVKTKSEPKKEKKAPQKKYKYPALIPVSRQWKLKIFERDGYKCLKCGTDQTILTVDHIKPLSLGGTNRQDNLQTLCYPCNQEKGQATIDYRVTPKDK